MSDYFQWIYFNLNENNYDTLRAYASIDVFGESKKNQEILSSDVGSFYDRIEFQDNRLEANSTYANTKLWINLGILIMILSAAYIIFKK